MKICNNWVCFILAICLCFYVNLAEAAYGSDYWFDREAEIDKFKKVLLFPISLEDRYNFQVQENGIFKDYINKNYELFNKQVKGIKFYSYGNSIDEKKHLLNDDEAQWKKIMVPFSSEADRAEAVFTEFAPDGYLVTHIYDVKTETDFSPEVTVNVPQEMYTVDSGGPDGYKCYDKKSWIEAHTIPAKYRQRNVMTMESTLYDDRGKKIFTAYKKALGYEDSYSGNFAAMYEKHRDELVDVLRNVKKNKYKIKQSKNPLKTIRIVDMVLPENISSNDYLIKSAWFVLKDEAYKMKKVNVVEDSGQGADYYVKVVIDDADYSNYWHEPSAYSMTKINWVQEYKWVDKDGNERTGKRTYYASEPIRDMYGGYSLSARFHGNMYLYDNKTDELLYSKYINGYGNSFIEHYRNAFKEFYKDVDKIAAGKKKLD